MTISRPPWLDREAVERIYPLRPAQQGMLFHELTAVGVSPYHRQVSFSLEGTVDEAACEAAWNSLLARHILLRSIFDYERTGQPLQIVLKNQTVEFGFEDLAGADAAARIAAWHQADMRRGFDLRRDRLMRVRLFRLRRDRFEMIWSHPHILLDGWSGAILLEEFAAFYAAARRGAPLALPPPIDPSAYLEALDARDSVAAIAHWAALLDGYDELATLPRAAGRHGPPRPVEHRFTIGERETAALFGLARHHDATPGVLLQALWGLLLGRWTGRRDVVFGIVVSGRSVATPNVERLVGMFINTVPMRVHWDGRRDFATLLRALRLQGLEGITHDHAALADVQAASGLPKRLLDHVLVVENYPAAKAPAVGTGFTVAGSTTTEQSNYDFGVMVHAGATLDFTLPYAANLFSPGLMARIEQQMRKLVAGLLGAPGAPLATIDPLPAGERQALVTWASGPTMPSPTTSTIADLWHAQADRTPDSIALVAGEQRFSYRALDRAADGVALRLATEGLAAEEPVAVLAERTADRIVALLGILKAGGVYLPLSTALPNERIAFMLKDAGCRRVLADPPRELRLSPLGPGLTRSIGGASGSHRAPHVGAAHHLAYIIYTSGSSGQPKGVAVEHRGFINMILAQIAGFGIRPADAVLQFASCSFDASLSEIFMALLAGARLVMATDAAIRDAAALLALMAAEGVTVATLPPSYLGALEGASIDGLRVLITAGEPPNARDARYYARQLRYFNAYGPSEASVCASWHEVDPDAPYAEGVPIGRPIANTKMMVMDRDGRTMMPIGAVGEICLAGPGLARGYIGRPELTAERFPTIDGDRIYRTGDTGLLQPDGNVLYLGRRDNQVKLNGYRVELGEIESRLRHHPSVAQAAATILEDPRRLVAYIVPRAKVDPEAVRLALAASLPPWMVPAEVIALPALPRTVAGKIDRRALAALAPEAPPDATPLTPADGLVAEAFAAVLGCRSFGRRTSFAASGGDSLRAIRLLGRLRRAGLMLDLNAMLGADTVSAIAAAAQRNTSEDHRLIVGTAPLTPIQRWFLQSHGIARLNHLVLLRAIDRSLDPPALAAALDAVWRHHDALRFTYRRTADGWIQEGTEPDRPFAARTIDLRDTVDPWSTIAADAARTGLAPGNGPLFKATHYRLACGDHLLLAAHHLVVDAASWRIIVEDLGAGLRQATAGLTIRLPGKTTAYRDWALALEDWSGGAAVAGERRYWEMVAAAEVAPLPADFERASHGYGDTDIVTADLGPVHPEVSERRILVHLLAALGAAMHQWDGRRVAQVLLSSHGRSQLFLGLDVSRTVGWFTAEFPFLLACESGADAIEAALAAVASNGLSWGALRWLSGTPIMLPEPELSLNYIGSIDTLPDQAFALSDRLPNVSFGATERRRLIEAEASVVAGRLALGIRYAPRVHAAATARRLIDDLAGAFVVARNGTAESK